MRRRALGKRITRRITRRREGKRGRRGGGNHSSMAVVWVEGRKVEGGEEKRRWREAEEE